MPQLVYDKNHCFLNSQCIHPSYYCFIKLQGSVILLFTLRNLAAGPPCLEHTNQPHLTETSNAKSRILTKNVQPRYPLPNNELLVAKQSLPFGVMVVFFSATRITSVCLASSGSQRDFSFGGGELPEQESKPNTFLFNLPEFYPADFFWNTFFPWFLLSTWSRCYTFFSMNMPSNACPS